MIYTLIIIFLVCIFFYFYLKKKNNEKLNQIIENNKNQIKLFFTGYYNLRNHYICKTEKEQFKEKWEFLYNELSQYHFSEKNNSHEEIIYFLKTFESFDDNIVTINNIFIKNESQKYDALF